MIMTKEDYKIKLEELKRDYSQKLRSLKRDYENSGVDYQDVINSIYVRKIFYKVTLKNIKRDGIIKFFWNKFLTERKYFYRRLRRLDADLNCGAWHVDIVDEIKTTTHTDIRQVEQLLAVAGDVLISKADKTISEEEVAIELDKVTKLAKKLF